MGKTIAVVDGAAEELAQAVEAGLAGYLSFSLCAVSGDTACSGGAEHDSLSGGISNALVRWDELIDSDACALVSAATEISSLDASLAQALMGIGDA